MKYATKYSVVPLVQHQAAQQSGEGLNQDSSDEYLISKLDGELTSILSQKLNLDEKVKLYSQTLAKFSNIYHSESFSLPTILAEMASQAKDSQAILMEKISHLNTKINESITGNFKSKEAKIKKELELKKEAFPGPYVLVDPPVLKKTKGTKRIDTALKRKRKLDTSQSNILTTKRKPKKTVRFPDRNKEEEVEQLSEPAENLNSLIAANPTDQKKSYFRFIPSSVTDFFVEK